MSDTEVKRGRPRPQEVMDRDEAVYAAIAARDGVTSEELSEATGFEKNMVYLSVFRLRKEGRVERQTEDGSGRTRRWVKTG